MATKKPDSKSIQAAKFEKAKAAAEPGLLKKAATTTNKIDRAETSVKTKQMVAEDTGLTYGEISVNQDLAADLNYSPSNKANLEGPIELDYFRAYNAAADPAELKKATTVGNLATMIYEKFIPEVNRK